MATSKYFSNHKNVDERKLLNELSIETIKQRGFDFLYSPRKMINEDSLFGEDGTSVFQTAVTLEMLIEDNQSFGGDGEFMAKVGLDVRDEVTFRFNKYRFYETVKAAYPECIRPFEGDIIVTTLEDFSNVNIPTGYAPGYAVWEITFVENEKEFYSLGDNYTFTCTAHLFRYSHETLDTGNDSVDLDVNSSASTTPSDNTEIQTDGDVLLDFTESSPFGTF